MERVLSHYTINISHCKEASDSLLPFLIRGQAWQRCVGYFLSRMTARRRFPLSDLQEKGIGTKMRVKLAAKMLVIALTFMKKKAFNLACLG